MKDWSRLQSALPSAPAHYVAHMRATLENMEGLTVKRKHRVGLIILVAALVLAMGTALAYTLISNQYFEDVATIQFEHGYYDDWMLAEKLSMLRLMKEYGVDMDTAEVDALLEGGMDDAERERRIDALMVARYGIEGRTDVIGLESILERELGEFDGWPMEQKAWYSQMLIDSGLMGSDDDIYRMPPENVLQPDEALAVARKEILAVWGLSEGELDRREVRWVYRTHVSDKEERLLHYEFRFLTEEGYGAPYYACAVSNDGRVMGSADLPGMMSPAEQKA